MKEDLAHWVQFTKVLDVHNQRLILEKGLFMKASGVQVQAAAVIQAKAKAKAKQLPGVGPQPIPLATSSARKRKEEREAGSPAGIWTPTCLYLLPLGFNHQLQQHQQQQ